MGFSVYQFIHLSVHHYNNLSEDDFTQIFRSWINMEVLTVLTKPVTSPDHKHFSKLILLKLWLMKRDEAFLQLSYLYMFVELHLNFK